MARSLVLAALAAVVMTGATASESKYVEMFETFKKEHSRKYESATEEAKRLKVFVENMKKAEELMRRNPIAKFGANEFADVSAAEFKTRHNAEAQYNSMVAKRGDVKKMYNKNQVRAAAGQSIDWRQKGAVTAVKNQGQCGSCWSFSTTGNIEGQWFLAGNDLVSLSEQEFVSCDTIDQGCNGGLMDNAFTWVVENHQGGVTGESDYPYVSGTGNVPQCELSGKPTKATISGHLDVAHDEAEMATWVYANGPLSIAVDATSWQTYMGGIMTDCISKQVDHGVLIVGFDDTNSPPYWIVKNSWAASWGEDGYIRVEKGKDQCLITTAPCSSKVTGGPQPPSPPGPQPPSPPSPPTPPTPNGGSFTQYQCQGSLCLTGCESRSFQTGTCLQDGAGGSVIATCGEQLSLKVYQTADCSGSYQENSQPLNQCLQDTQGSYIYDTCGSSLPIDAKPAKADKVVMAKAVKKQ